jgi:nucleotide-binding universal stress UspA family protein
VNVLIATDGKLEPELAARFAKPLAGPTGTATVLTVIEIPRRLLTELRSHFGEMEGTIIDRDAEYVAGAIAHDVEPRGWPGDDAVIQRYLDDKRDEYTGPIVAQLQAMGVKATGDAIEGESAASAILGTIEERGIDVLLIGSHGQGLFEGLLGSTGTRLTRQSSCPVLVLRS